MTASQLGAVAVSSVPDEKSGEVGGVQTTGTQLGASIGTARAGAVLVSAMTASFFTNIQNNPNVPDSVVSQAHTELAGGVPFVPEADVRAGLDEANVPTATADEIVKANEQSQIDGLRAAEAILAPFAPRRPPVHLRHPDCSTWRASQAQITPRLADSLASHHGSASRLRRPGKEMCHEDIDGCARRRIICRASASVRARA
jgi:hypothetical protein